MSDLTDDELRARLKYAMGERHLEPFVEPLRELQRHRAEGTAARVNMAAVGVTEDGPIDQLVCTLAGLYLELQQKTSADRTASAELVRAAVRKAIAGSADGALVTPNDRYAASIADRVVALLTGVTP